MTVVVAAAVAAACGDNQSVSPTTTARPASADTACPTGEYPAVGALDLATGAVVWSTCSPDETYRTIVGATADVVLVAQSNGPDSSFTIAFAAADGSELWSRSTPHVSVPRGPVAGHDIVVLVTDDEGSLALVGVDLLTGDERWRVNSAIDVLGQNEDVVVVADRRDGGVNYVRGIDRETGEILWPSLIAFSDQSGVGVARGAAAVWENTIAVPTGSTLTGVDINTGDELWTAPQIDHPEGADGVFVGAQHSSGQASSLSAVDAATGATLWSAPGRSSYGDVLAVGDGVVVVLDANGSEYIAYELRTGDERWRAPRSSPGEPQLIEGTSLVVLWEGSLGVVSTPDGSMKWSTLEPLGSPLMNSVGSNATMVFVAVNSLPWGD